MGRIRHFVRAGDCSPDAPGVGGCKRGFSLLEIMIVLCLAMILMGISSPLFLRLMQNSRRDSAVQRMVGDLRSARSQAVLTGWQYRIFGFTNGSPSDFNNQYRLMGRSSSAIAWPADEAVPSQSATQFAGQWVDVNELFRGVTINPADGTPRFWVAFDSRGARSEMDASFAPLVFAAENSGERSLRVSAVGSVRVE